jgi:hypothetical protein
MTDKELLEAAARAAGLKYATKPEEGDELGRIYSEHLGLWIWHFPDWWNPLRDDGDALRLAVKLELDLCLTLHGAKASMPNEISADCWNKDDPYAAVRRAIVRAAAEIGRTK